MEEDKKIKLEKKEVYFLISFERKKTERDEVIEFTDKENTAECLFTKEEEKEKNLFFIKIFKGNYYKKEKRSNISLPFKIKEDEYEISFTITNTFIYNINLKLINSFYGANYEIEQSIIEYYEKLSLYDECLTEKNAEDKKDILYADTINLYSKIKNFKLLIKLFTILYKNKIQCSLLLDTFNQITNEKDKEKKREKDTKKNNGNKNETKDSKKINKQTKNIEEYVLKSFNESIQKICNESESLISQNSYNPKYFYSIILCYLNNYNYEAFIEQFEKIYKENKNILFEIMLSYKSYLKNYIKKDFMFFNEFIEYTTKKSYDDLNNGLFYLTDINTFLKVLEYNKEQIILMKNFGPILVKTVDNFTTFDIKELIKYLDLILSFSEQKKKLFIYFNTQFWENIKSNYSSATRENIQICNKLRQLFQKYYTIAKNSEITKIKEDSQKFYNRECYELLLHKNIKIFIQKDEDIENINIINLIMKYDIYYIDSKNKKYENKRDIEIFNKINFEKIDQNFIDTFKKYNFEILFENDIQSFLLVFFDKVKKIEDIDIILELIQMDNLKSAKQQYIDLLINKYDFLIGNILDYNDEEINNIIKVLANLTKFIFEQQNNINFIKNNIGSLDMKIKNKIYFELIKFFDEDRYKDLTEYIKNIFFKLIKEEKIDDFIIFMNKLSINHRYSLIEKIGNNYIINKNDFYFKGKNIKIELLINLIKNDLVNESYYYYSQSLTALKDIYDEIIDNKIRINDLTNFFKNNEEIISKRINLFKYIEGADYEKLYEKKNFLIEIEKMKSELFYIRQALEEYYNEECKEAINNIKDKIKVMEKDEIKKIDKIDITNIILKYKEKADEVNKIKNSKLFPGCYNKYQNIKNQDQRFKEALKFYNKLIQSLTNHQNDDDSKKILNEMKNIIDPKYIKEIEAELKDKTHINQKDGEIAIYLHAKEYENDINSIFFFFNNFKKGEKEDAKWNQFLSSKYKNISKKGYEDIKLYLSELKEKGIYDPNIKINYILLFRILNNNNQAYDFLLKKTPDNIELLQDKIDGRDITIKDIKDTSDCVGFFQEIKKKKDNLEIFEYIKNVINDEYIKKFDNFITKSISIIQLDKNFDFSINVYKNIYNIISNASFSFFQDYEEFIYGDDKKTIDIKFLKNLMNKIHIYPKEIKKCTNNDSNPINKRNKSLLVFKNVVKNIETIYDYMSILRNKGSSLPICIKIEIKKNLKNDDVTKIENDFIIKYFIEKKEKKFQEIQKFLFNVKNNLILKLDIFYKEKTNMRFIYGKQIDSILKYLNGLKSVVPIDSFLRYILNETDNKIKINEGEIKNPRNTNDYINQYDLYNDNSFQNICNYITSLFQNNNSSIEKHYEKMILKGNHSNKFKGIFLYESSSNSMEDDILQIFLEYTRNLPIAQNILIINKETSYEEMQAFFHRAILCKYNTIFVIELNQSFSDSQKKDMNNFINKLLAYKKEKYSIKANETIDINNTKEYMDSCIIFVYDKKENESFLEINDFAPPNFQKIDKKIPLNVNESFSSDLETSNSINLLYQNTHIISSEICGLGKSTKIKNLIKNKDKEYVYFPLGGILTKKIIYEKLNNILKSIETKDYNHIAIHLDLFENDEESISILKEFLFSFLITKFYSINQYIIYIPKNIEIFIEIPNCFNDFKSNYNILNSFDPIKIDLNDLPELQLSKKKMKLFKNMLNLNSQNEIRDFIKNNIGKDIFSYHQIRIFIKLFICQYSKFNEKLKFLKDGKDITPNCITNFIKGTKYFILGGFSKSLIEDANSAKPKNKRNNEEYIELMNKIYSKDILEKYDSPIIFINKEKLLITVDISDEGLKKCINSEDFLKILKKILYLENPIDKEKNNEKISLTEIIERDKYVITQDNFRKMILILYRILANIPVILMGETGCGKTTLITKLNELLNNGVKTLEKIDVHPGINDEYLINEMNKINDKARNQKKEIWIFFDELNTCNSLSLLTEIFTNRSFNRIKLEKNIRLIGACNPYRKRKKNEYIYGLTDQREDNEIIYNVNPMPQSLMYYVFNFGSIDSENEKKYISSIISELFNEKEQKELVLKEKTADLISVCHIFLREKFGNSIVSLREMNRFKICCKFLINRYYPNKNKIINKIDNKEAEKIKAIIISIYLCYAIRLIDKESRSAFDSKLQPKFLELVNYNKIDQKMNKNNSNYLMSMIEEPLKSDIKNDMTDFQSFRQIIELEQEFILAQIELEKGIGNNNLLRENLFLLFISLVTHIPLIIIGKPGTGKSLSAHLMIKTMKGKFSNSNFFRLFPSILHNYFQGSRSTTPDDVESFFNIAEKKLDYLKEEQDFILMLLFDELGLAEKSKSNPLKVLHSKLEYRENQNNISFIGISNWTLDSAKLNRAIILSVRDLDEFIDDLTKTSQSIAKSIDINLEIDEIFEVLLPSVYFEYKQFLKILKLLLVYKLYELEEFNKEIKNQLTDEEFNNIFPGFCKEDLIKYEEFKKQKNDLNKLLKEKGIKNISWFLTDFKNIMANDKFIKLLKKDNFNVDFHGNRDFFYLIKGIANDFFISNNNINPELKKNILEKYICRNFGGLEIDIDVDLNLEFEDANISKAIKYIKKFNFYNGNNTKINSEDAFIQILNYCCEEKEMNYIIEKKDNKYNEFFKSIIYNINDYNSRYLLLQIKPSLGPLIYQNIKEYYEQENTFFYEGSPFVGDKDLEYQHKMINIIQGNAGKESLLVLQNLNQIYPFLYDLFNMNYVIKDGKKYARICLGNFSDQLVYIQDTFRIIIMLDKKFISKADPPFINRFEKVIVSSTKLLDRDKNQISKFIYENELNLKKYLNNNIIKYQIKDLLIGCKKQDIEGLIYNYYNRKKNNKINFNLENDNEIIEIRQEILSKIAKLLSQDIIVNLPENKDIRKKYFEQKKYNNLQEYIKKEGHKYLISIIYTFTNISSEIKNVDESLNSIMISTIRKEEKFKNDIDDIINRNKSKNPKMKNIIFLKFNNSNSKILNFIINFIKNYYDGENIIFILIIHITRNFEMDKNDIIYSILDIYDYIQQAFIDNLNGNNVEIKKILERPRVKDIINMEGIFEIDKELNKIINRFINSNNNYFSKEKDDGKYLQKLINYFLKDNNFMIDIVEKAKTFVDDYRENLIENIYRDHYINKNSIDMISIVIEYIKEKIISKNILYILSSLENNNILTSLLNLNDKKDLLSEEIINDIKEECLKKIKFEENIELKPKFDFDFILPGFYHFHQHLSKFICLKITGEFMRNEKKIRKLLNGDIIDAEKKFHERESLLLSILYCEIEENDFIFSLFEKIDSDLILNDYITFYIKKIDENISFDSFQFIDKYHRLLNLILNLRFTESHNIIKMNKDQPIKRLLIKIIWLESNINYIIKIIHLFSLLNTLFSEDDNELIDIIDEIIKGNNLKYITNEKRNPKHTTEVNESYYILLGSFCLSILPQNIDFKNIDEQEYFETLKNAIKIIEILNNDLMIYLNEMYIIDELIKIYDILVKKNKLTLNSIDEISRNLKENNDIIQSNEENKQQRLIQNIFNLIDLIKKYLIDEDREYYNLLNYIFFKEIKKISEINYRIAIFKQMVTDNEMILNINEILKILLKPMISTSKEKLKNFKDLHLNFLNENNNEILNIIENELNPSNPNNQLLESLIYFFEKVSHIYLNYFLNSKENNLLEEEPLEIFLILAKFLQDLDKFGKKMKYNNKNLTKLFCISYIKSFCFIFISLINKKSSKLLNQLKIINEIKTLKGMQKIIILYIYKIIYNQNKKSIDIFLNPEYISKYKIDKYDFREFIITNEENPFSSVYMNKNSKSNNNKNYEFFYEKLEKYQNKKFTEVNIKDINIKELGIDIFYFASCNMILSCLKYKDFYKSPYYINFYENVCIPLFQDNIKIFNAIQIFYNPEKYEKIKNKYDINIDDLEILLYSYRYFINQINSNSPNSIFGFIYNKQNFANIQEYYYPGNDIRKEIKYHELYSEIKDHFKYKNKNQGCFVCLCENGYYDSYPNSNNPLNCMECKKPMFYFPKKINSFPKFKSKMLKPVKRKKYFKIFKNEKEMEKDNSKDFYNYITLDKFKEEYMYNYFMEEKGITKIDENHFKKENKVIRNLSQISYRILNFILYSHLFFARLYTDNIKLDYYKPDNMKWIDLIRKCWELLKSELSKEEISIEIFMNYIFFDIFNILSREDKITEFQKYISFEDSLEKLITTKKDEFKKKYTKAIKKCNKDDKFFYEYLLAEEYQNVELNEYPFYNYFYYTEYINTDYLLRILNLKEKDKYPVLLKYLENIINEKKEHKYSLNNLNIYNTVLNLFNDAYSRVIIRGKAKEIILEDEEIYKNNKELIKKFISFYNNLDISINDIKLKLSEKNKLSDFFIDENLNYGKSYKNIYHEFINEQNNQISELLEIKIKKGIFDYHCKNKVNIQDINEDEIFILNSKESFIDVIFNSSYRKYILNNNISYNQFEINFDLIEEKMTEELLKGKKLFNNNVNDIIYKNEDLTFENTNILSMLKKELSEEISLNDKVALYKYYNENKENINLFNDFINDFITIIIFLNNNFVNKKSINLKLEKSSKIYECNIYLNDRVSDNFKNFFDKKDITISKLVNLFEFYLIIIFEIIKNELSKYCIEVEEINRENLRKYLEKEHNITKEDLINAFRLFISIFLYKVKDKDNKIKNNFNNVGKYMNIPDIWNYNIYQDKENFNYEIKEIINMNFQINQIIPLYELLDENIEKKYFSEIKEKIRMDQLMEKIRKEKEREKKEREKEKERNNVKENENEGKENEQNKEIEKGEEDSEDNEEFNPDKYYKENIEEEDEDEDRD